MNAEKRKSNQETYIFIWEKNPSRCIKGKFRLLSVTEVNKDKTKNGSFQVIYQRKMDMF